MTNAFEPVSVIVVNHNGGELLLECVAVATEQAQEVIVVDNLSTDSSMERLASLFAEQPRVKLIFSRRNI